MFNLLFANAFNLVHSKALVTSSDGTSNRQKMIVSIQVCLYPFSVRVLSSESAPYLAISVDVRFIKRVVLRMFKNFHSTKQRCPFDVTSLCGLYASQTDRKSLDCQRGRILSPDNQILHVLSNFLSVTSLLASLTKPLNFVVW